MVFQHEALNLIGAGVGRDTDRRIIHDAADRCRADCAAVGLDVADDLAKCQHAYELAVLHDDERADILVAHGAHGLGNRHVG